MVKNKVKLWVCNAKKIQIYQTLNIRNLDVRCPSCGYVRKAEDIAPEWQCPSCQVAYGKTAQYSSYSYMISNSAPGSVSKQSNGLLKIVIAMALLGSVFYFGYSVTTDTSIITAIGFPFQDNQELLTNKKAELKAYEDGLGKVEAEIAHNKANVGTCSITGQPNQFILDKDPRPELQAKIEKLKEEIRVLENKS